MGEVENPRSWLNILVGVILVVMFIGAFVLLTITTGSSASQAIFVNETHQTNLRVWLKRQGSGSFPRMSAQQLHEPNAGIEALYELATNAPEGFDIVEYDE